ncbi:MAG: oligosaccharyl transferase STT3 subunit [Pseudodesulfovibrio sp.]|nr:oligosaccharyl transferase STT3 subunit [Pseudodesulfovibrio sp.]
MESFKQLYKKSVQNVGDVPFWVRDWRWIGVWSLAVYLVVLAFRLSFAGRWDNPELWVNGERILATHDAYFWLAKAKGIGVLKGYPLAEAASYLHQFTGMGLGTIGFWAPAFMASFVAIICYLWGWLIAGRNAGILAGLAGALTPGFYFRSRLGYFDTDLFTLLMPMLVAWMLAYWALKHTKDGWFFSLDEKSEREKSGVPSLWLAFAFGLVTRFAIMWHYDIINISILYFFMTVVVIFINGEPGKRIWAFYGLIIYLLAAFPGSTWGSFAFWPLSLIPVGLVGISHTFLVITFTALFVFLLGCLARRGSSFLGNAWVCACLFLLVVAATNIGQASMSNVVLKLSGYFNPALKSSVNANGAHLSVIYPSILQSIIEAKHVALSQILERGAFASWLGWLALMCSVVVVFLRPVAVFLLPLVALHLVSVKLGIRFSMFGGAALFVYLGVGVFWLVDIVARRYTQRQWIGIGVQAFLGASFLVFCYAQYSKIPLTPVVTKAHAEGLVELGEKAPLDSMIWTWWDWGYASQYYAGMETVADGGKHAGRDIYPLALALSTDSPRQSNQIVRLASQYKAKRKYIFGYALADTWDTMPSNEVMSTISDLRTLQYSKKSATPQYLVVSWKDLTISKWITYYGNWNLETGKTRAATVRLYDPGEIGFNIQRGAVQNKFGQGGLVCDIDILDWGKVTNRHYAMNAVSMKLVPETPYMVINKVTRQSVMPDRMGYNSMLFRLLTGNPEDAEISKNFKLVVERLPFVRIYEVVQD